MPPCSPAPTTTRCAPGKAGGGPIPAELVREIVRHSLDETTTTLRRLYQSPTGRFVAMESTSRCFPAGLAELVRIRDETCRTAWCDAPIRHTDHVVAHDDDGPTTYGNAQGLCEACNHAKQAPGWRARPGPGDTVETTTPTGHRYQSLAPGRPPPHLSSRNPLTMQVWHGGPGIELLAWPASDQRLCSSSASITMMPLGPRT